MYDEIKKIDPNSIISSILTDNGKNYTIKKGKENHLFERTCSLNKTQKKIRRPQTNGKVEYTHLLYDKKFYKKYRFQSFKDREEKLKEFTN